MESLAYLHYTLAYEASGSSDPSPSVNVRKFFQQLNWHKCSSTVSFWFLWLATILAVLSVFNNTLAQSFGEQSERVREVQQRLSERGYITPNNITGFFGSITRDALRQFKRDFNIPIGNDSVDPQTAEALGLRRAIQTQSTNVSTVGATVRRGNIGSAVSDLQRRLRDLGYYFGSIDGDFGSSTETAVIQFQQNNGLTGDGIAGPATWNVLLSGRAFPATIATAPQVNRLPSPRVPIRPPSTTFSQFAVPSSTFSNIGTLQRGDRGVEVFDLQSRLQQLGFYQGELDQIFGPQTETAVFQYQLSRRLSGDGIATPQTIARIRQETSESLIPAESARFFPGFARGTYVVVVPDRDNNTLTQVRGLKSEAFLARNKRGRYVNAGEYDNRSRAESQSYLLRERGLDARVVYFKR